MPGAAFFDVFMRAALLPRGPPEFLVKAYNAEAPLARGEFERGQDRYRRQYNLPALRRRSRSSERRSRRSRSRDGGRRRSRERSGERAGKKSKGEGRGGGEGAKPRDEKPRDGNKPRSDKPRDDSKSKGEKPREERRRADERSGSRSSKPSEPSRPGGGGGDKPRERGKVRGGEGADAPRPKGKPAAGEDDRWQPAGAPEGAAGPAGGEGEAAPSGSDARLARMPHAAGGRGCSLRCACVRGSQTLFLSVRGTVRYGAADPGMSAHHQRAAVQTAVQQNKRSRRWGGGAQRRRRRGEPGACSQPLALPAPLCQPKMRGDRGGERGSLMPRSDIMQGKTRRADSTLAAAGRSQRPRRRRTRQAEWLCCRGSQRWTTTAATPTWSRLPQ
jgi:hypothetical protein